MPETPSLDPVKFVYELKIIPPEERMSMMRTWVQDRSPVAFSSEPYLWEAVREWIAKKYNLSPRQIGLAGSAQIGFSTHPRKAFARFQKDGSDLDIYIVSEALFKTLEQEALLFIKRQRTAEKSDFLQQADTIERIIKRGYVDIHHIPAKREHYPYCARLKNDASILIDKLGLSGFRLKPSHFRVYADWHAKAKWTKIQIDALVKSLPLLNNNEST